MSSNRRGSSRTWSRGRSGPARTASGCAPWRFRRGWRRRHRFQATASNGRRRIVTVMVTKFLSERFKLHLFSIFRYMTCGRRWDCSTSHFIMSHSGSARAPSSAEERRRRYLVRNLSGVPVSDLIAALSAADHEAEYFCMSLPEQNATISRMPTAIILCASSAIPDSRDMMFREFNTLFSVFPGVSIICITDDEDPDFLEACYDKGVRQVLPAQLGVSVAVQVLQLIEEGGTFIPSRLLI